MLNRFSPALCVGLFVTLWTVTRLASLSMGFSRQEYWSGLPCPPPGDLPNSGFEPESLISPALVGGFFTTIATWEAPHTVCDGTKRAEKCHHRYRVWVTILPLAMDKYWWHYTVLIYSYNDVSTNNEFGTIIIHILQMRKVKHEKGKWFAHVLGADQAVEWECKCRLIQETVIQAVLVHHRSPEVWNMTNGWPHCPLPRQWPWKTQTLS